MLLLLPLHFLCYRHYHYHCRYSTINYNYHCHYYRYCHCYCCYYQYCYNAMAAPERPLLSLRRCCCRLRVPQTVVRGLERRWRGREGEGRGGEGRGGGMMCSRGTPRLRLPAAAFIFLAPICWLACWLAGGSRGWAYLGQENRQRGWTEGRTGSISVFFLLDRLGPGGGRVLIFLVFCSFFLFAPDG